MTRRNHTQALKRAAGSCRNRRRPQGQRRKAWVRPFRRARRALDSSLGLIQSTLRTAADSSLRAPRRPVQASRDLQKLSKLLNRVSSRLLRAIRDLEEAQECAAREPQNAGDVPELLVAATERWLFIGGWLNKSADMVSDLQQHISDDLRTGALLPEPSASSRPRIVLAPRLTPIIRAFLLLRQPRVVDRIASLLRRRRRTPRPAALTVPQPSILGRAPPLFSVCVL